MSAKIVSVSEWTSTDIDSKGAGGGVEGGGGPLGSEETSGKEVICIESWLFTFWKQKNDWEENNIDDGGWEKGDGEVESLNV